MTTEKETIPRLLEAAEIVRQMAEREPITWPTDEMRRCSMCTAYQYDETGAHQEPFPHTPDCPWLAARRWVEAGR